MANFGKRKIIEVLDEFNHPDANGEYGSVVLFKTDEALSPYSIAIDYVDNGKGGNWTRAYSQGSEERARQSFAEEVANVKGRTEKEVAIQHSEKKVKEQFRSMFWLELDANPDKIVLCKDFDADAVAGKQWKWGRLKSWLPKSEESAKTIFSWEVVKLAQQTVRKNGRIFSAQKKIIDKYNYLLLIEMEDKKGGFAVFEDGVENAFLAYFSKDEQKYARWTFESRKAEVDIVLDRLETQRRYVLKMEKLKEVDMKVIGFTSYDNPAIEEMLCSAEQNVAWGKIVEFMKQHGLQFSGTHHQNGDDGVPVLNNGRKFVMSMRTWGGLMAEVADIPRTNTAHNMSYCKWAWDSYNEPVFPREKGIRVYEYGKAVEDEEKDFDLDELIVDTRPTYQEWQRMFAKEGYFKMPRVMTVNQLLEELESDEADTED